MGSKQDSYGFDVMHDHQLIRVFSARDYEGHGNDGAILYLSKKVLNEFGELEDMPKTSSRSKNRGKSGRSASKSKCQNFIISVRAQVLRSVTKSRVDVRQAPAASG